MPVAYEGGVQVAVAVNFRAADEAEVDIACGHGAHDVEGAGGPECAVDVGRVTHGVEQFGGWDVTHDACFKKAYAMGSVRAFGKGKADQGEAHAHKNIFTVVYLACST